MVWPKVGSAVPEQAGHSHCTTGTVLGFTLQNNTHGTPGLIPGLPQAMFQFVQLKHGLLPALPGPDLKHVVKAWLLSWFNVNGEFTSPTQA